MHPRLAFDPMVRRVAWLVPPRVLHRCARWALADRQVALCLHRVGGRLSPAPDAAPGLFIPGHVLDEVIRRARGIGGERRWLTLSFDDGYRDAVRYVTLRAAQHPEIDWRVFVCPDKARRQSGFRWDAGLNPLASLPCDTVELIGENERPELLRAGSDPTTAVASLEELRSLWERDASTVGNHTNSHLPLAGLPPELATLELEASVACFEREVGPSRSFAFPFGTPGVYWGPEHASHLSSLGLEEIWSVQSRTFGAKERSCGAVLPRFPVDGRDSAHTILSLVVARASLERFRTRNLGSKQAVAARLVRRGCGYELGQSLVPLGGVPLDATAVVVNTEVFNHDLFHAFSNITHVVHP